ncbi:hypothetical protein J1N10_04560 [Carboxylicivirga sp. A043]|uniref:hypothetical protein n=1 Tax=Carboxylicivirga litoralis TaxID=2816963 RepID=UPI0021CAE7E2|nr:hypothetical protein [Carboxylicivirga sp. A043]MCU4155234.1 hypothetical protein [Carboxylicivirga sp. A043]
MNTSYLSIPGSICCHAVQKKRIYELQLFCWLKLQCSGHFKLNNQLLDKAYRELAITKLTLKKRLNNLLKWRWIGLNRNSGSYHINSFKVLHRRLDDTTIISGLWDGYDFKKFKGFIQAVALYTVAKKKQHYEFKLAKENGRRAVAVGMKKGRSSLNGNLPSFSLPIHYIAKKLNIKPGYVSKMKSAAKCAKFISTRKQKEEVKDSVMQSKHARKYHPEAHKYFFKDGKLFEQLPDKITFLFIAKRNRRLKHN